MNGSDIQSLRSRPRFRKILSGEANTYLSALATSLKKHEDWEGSQVGSHVFIRIAEPQRHFWSPQLGLEIEDTDEGVLLRGLYGPKPAIWTMFVFLYSAFGFATLALSIWGTSQLWLGQRPWALWIAPISLLLILVTYLLAHFGQKLGYEQMEHLHLMLLNVLLRVKDSEANA